MIYSLKMSNVMIDEFLFCRRMRGGDHDQ